MRPLFTLMVCLLFAAPETGAAQEFRVYTTVRAIDTAEQPIVGRSLTLFRGGRAYDWLEDTGQVVVSDRVRGSSVVLSRQLDGTRIEADQLAHFLKVGKSEATTYLETVTDPAARASVGFTLTPRFETEFQEELQRLVLRGGGWTYTIHTQQPQDRAMVDAYLDYADRAAAVNFLLHPHATYPAMRQAVNEELRRLGRLPVSVTLDSRVTGVHLRADHQYGWALQSFDLSKIRQWEALAGDREGEQVRWTTLRAFQQQTLAAD